MSGAEAAQEALRSSLDQWKSVEALMERAHRCLPPEQAAEFERRVREASREILELLEDDDDDDPSIPPLRDRLLKTVAGD